MCGSVCACARTHIAHTHTSRAHTHVHTHTHTHTWQYVSVCVSLCMPHFARPHLLVFWNSVIEASKEHPQGYVMFIMFLTFWTTIAAPVTPVEIGGGCVFGPGTSVCA